MALREIFAHFGFDFDKSALDKASAGVDKVKASAEGAETGFGHFAEGLKGAIAGLVGGEIVRFIGETAEAAEQIQKTSEQVGLSTDELQTWQLGVKLAGADVNDFTVGIKRLSVSMAGNSADSAATIALFKKLGVSTKDPQGKLKDLGSVLPDIAEGFKNIQNPTESAAIATELFGRSGGRLAPLLAKGAAGIADLRVQFKELGGGFSPEALKQGEEYQDSIKKLDFAFTGLKSQLLIGIVPVLTTMVEKFAAGAATFSEWIKGTTALRSAFLGLAVALGVTLWAALAPFILPGLQFLAIFLAVDDLVAFLEGKDSIIGDILTAWFGEDTVGAIRNVITDLKEFIGSELAGAWDLAKILAGDASDETAGKFMMATNRMSDILDGFFDYVKATWMQIGLYVTEAILGLEAAWNQFVDSIAAKLGPLGQLAHNAAGEAFKIDTGKSEAGLTGSSVAARQAEIDRLKGGALAFEQRTANGQQIVQAPGGPLKAPVASTNWVELNAPITVNLPAGVGGEQAKFIARTVAAEVGNQRRASLEALTHLGGKE